MSVRGLTVSLTHLLTRSRSRHAGSARQALSRLRFICQLSDNELPLTALNSLVTEAIDVVVHCARTPKGPQVTEVIAVEDLSASPDGTAFTITELFRRDGVDAPLTWSGQLPQRLARPFRDAGYDPTYAPEHDPYQPHHGAEV